MVESSGNTTSFVVEGFMREFSDSERERLGRWSQGCLLQGVKIPFITGESDALIGRVSETDADGWMVVVSQTCDVVLGGPGEKHPWVQCCPLVDASMFSEGFAGNARAGRVTYLAPVSCPDGVERFADLRVSVPVHKSVLAQLEPVKAWSDESEVRRIANQFAMKFRRPALPDVLAEEVSSAVEKLIKESQEPDTWHEEVVQLRVEAEPGFDNPRSVSIMVVSRRKLSSTERAVWRSLNKPLEKLLKTRGVRHFPIRFFELKDINPEDFARWQPLRIDGLNPGSYLF